MLPNLMAFIRYPFIILTVQITKYTIMQFSPAISYFVSFTSKYSPQQPAPRHAQCYYVNKGDQVSHSTQLTLTF